MLNLLKGRVNLPQSHALFALDSAFLCLGLSFFLLDTLDKPLEFLVIDYLSLVLDLERAEFFVNALEAELLERLDIDVQLKVLLREGGQLQRIQCELLVLLAFSRGAKTENHGGL